MWKLREDIDFKELKKFGFEDDGGIYIKMTEDGTGRDSGTQEFLIVVYEEMTDKYIIKKEK